MKVSLSDNYIIIHRERFDAGKEPFHLVPKFTELAYLSSFLIMICLSGFNWLNLLSEVQSAIITYGDKHHLEMIVYSVTFTILIIGFIDDLFFRKVSIRVEYIYRIDRNHCVLPHPSYNYHQDMIIPDENTVDVIDSIDIYGVNNISTRISSYYDDDIKGFPVSVETTYKVIIKFRSGESSTIESNSLCVGSCHENQIAFRELMAEAQSSVEKIKLFLLSSKQ